jgi:CubicO group peptidase (beta-lactamase class C family)
MGNTSKKIKMTKIFLILIAFLISTFSVVSQDVKNQKIDSILTSLESNNTVMGSMFITKNNEDVYSRSIGFSSLEDKIKSSEKTKYRIGSITKMYTATMIFQLVDDSKLNLDQHLSDFFPKIKNAGNITIGNLLSHRSGIYNLTRSDDFNPYKMQLKREMLAKIEKSEPDSEPNIKTEYSNTNFILLGYILEEIYNQPYSEILKSQIADILDLNNTYYGDFINTKNNEALSYTFNEKWKKSNETHMSLPHGAGAIVSTPQEVTIFMNGLMEGKLISAKSLEQMKVITDGIGYGIGQFSMYDRSIYGHSGGIDGFTSLVIYEPREKVTIAFTSNGSQLGLRNIVIEGLDSFMDIPFEKTEAIEVSDEYLNNYVGLYSSEQAPFTLTFYVKDNSLFGGPTGNHHNKLVPSKENQFLLESDGATANFTPENDGLLLLINGMELTFSKKQ